jgi:16S rRNA processing protein RimM
MEQRSTSKSTDKRGRPAAASGRGRTSAIGTAAGGRRSDDPIVGVVGAPHGVRGEVKVHPRTDVADRFQKGSRLLCDGMGELLIASVRGAIDVPIVRFDGLNTRNDAERIRGRNLRVSRAEARRAAKDAYLWADLLGLRAETTEGRSLGVVSEVLRAGETDVIVVRAEGSREEQMFPAIASVVREVDIAGGRIVLVPQEVLG